MREIEFRGKAEEDGEWMYGDLIQRCDTYISICDGGDIPVDPATVGQYTGMKDRNGKKIYEGDIIGGSNGSINGYEWPFQLEIKWDEKRCEFNVPAWGYMDSTHYYEVIGNVHDNPELIRNYTK